MSSSKPNNSGIPRKTPLNPLAQSSTKSNGQIKVNKQKGKSSDSNKHGSIKSDEPIAKSILKLEEDHKRMKAILEGTVKDAEEKLEYMKSLVEKSVEVNKDSEKVSESENKQSHHEGENDENVDDENVCDDIKERHYMTKSKLKSMREKLKEMNSKTQMFMDEAEKMTQDIKEIESMSIRIGNSVEDDKKCDIKKETSVKDTNSVNSFKHTHTDTVFITETEDSH
ncbi:hypothetical protein LOTGIDRAFT_164477 [Lottia gigantea]|uniref:Uncharacterized protein n=1 Tax=Lottia gigantea TaxID=225164 RepID=V4A0H4_LOTGI|nr:hypothetical protein LOTGIDRAFT_164477 [Lottia gigantea]ESO90167.1 hypothetical protein LOTGIDRAFT_164477 [Lottia gigantea]